MRSVAAGDRQNGAAPTILGGMPAKKKRTRSSKSTAAEKKRQPASPGAPGGTRGGELLKKLNEVIAPEDVIDAACQLGAIKRQRKVDMQALVQATVTAMAPIPGAETTAFANYITLTGLSLAHSAFYDRFSEPFAALMRELALRAVRAVRDVSPHDEVFGDYGRLLEHFTDIRITDSTCHMLKGLAKAWAPSTSRKRPAGVKFHTVISLCDHLPLHGEITAQRVHDNKAFFEGSLEEGTLSLFDLGYIDVERFIGATERGASFITRLKESHDPEIIRVHLGAGSKREARSKTISEAMHDPNILDSTWEGLIDLDVRLKHGSRSAIVRATSVEDEDGTRHWYLTNVDRETLSPRDIAETYRLRWEVELLFKQIKSGAGLNALLAWRPSAVAAFIYAKLVGLCLMRLLDLALADRPGVRGHLALMLALSRSMPLLLSIFMIQRGVTLAQLEERLLMIAEITARSRNRRREREKRKRRQAIGDHDA
jgi:hypothetical protein